MRKEFSSSKKLLFIHLRKRKAKKEGNRQEDRMTEWQRLHYHPWFTPQMPVIARADSSWSQELGSPTEFPAWRAGAQALGPSSNCLSGRISRKQDWKQNSQDLKCCSRMMPALQAVASLLDHHACPGLYLLTGSQPQKGVSQSIHKSWDWPWSGRTGGGWNAIPNFLE